jgi:ribosome-associated protein
VFDVAASAALTDEQKERVLARAGPRIVAVAQDTRSQTRNRALALARLRHKLERALTVRRRRKPTAPTAASRRRRVEDKRRRGERKRERRPPDAGD